MRARFFADGNELLFVLIPTKVFGEAE